jgi:hypothetical protein
MFQGAGRQVEAGLAKGFKFWWSAVFDPQGKLQAYGLGVTPTDARAHGCNSKVLALFRRMTLSRAIDCTRVAGGTLIRHRAINCKLWGLIHAVNCTIRGQCSVSPRTRFRTLTLENRYTGRRTVSSNPTLPPMLHLLKLGR